MGTIITLSVTGFVGSEVTVRDAGDQRAASFSVAVNRKVNGDQQTLWVRVNCWNKLADVAQQYVRKGGLVQVTAEWMRPTAWLDQNGNPQASVDFTANRLILLDRQQADDDQPVEDVPF